MKTPSADTLVNVTQAYCSITQGYLNYEWTASDHDCRPVAWPYGSLYIYHQRSISLSGYHSVVS